MTSQLPSFRHFFFSAAEKNTLKNGAAVMSLRSFLFPEDFSDQEKLLKFEAEGREFAKF